MGETIAAVGEATRTPWVGFAGVVLTQALADMPRMTKITIKIILVFITWSFLIYY